jgi:hypothetical protein
MKEVIVPLVSMKMEFCPSMSIDADEFKRTKQKLFIHTKTNIKMTQIKIVPDMSWADQFHNSIAESTNPDVALLDGLTVVVVENKAGGHYLQDCHGVTMAIELLRENPSQRIILSGVMPLAMVLKKKPELGLLLGRDNIRFLELPYSIDQFIDIWKDVPTNRTTASAIQKYTNGIIGVILHGMKVADPKHPQNGNEQSMVARALSEASDNEVLDFLQEAAARREEVRKGEYLEGVFCDCEGTIIVDGNINEKVLEQLKAFESEGKTVTMWTDGDISVIGKLLSENSITYSLHSKREFAGAEVEVAIDDMDEFAFSARTKISARKFIRV